MITVEHLTKTCGAFTAVNDVSFTARRGRAAGFLGPDSAGTSATLRSVTGLTPPTRGTAHVADRHSSDVLNPGLGVGAFPDASAQHADRTGRPGMTAPDCLDVFRVQGHLDGNWAGWLGDLALDRNEDGITNLTGPLIDQPHLHGVLAKVCDLGVTLIAVTPAGSTQTTTEKE